MNDALKHLNNRIKSYPKDSMLSCLTVAHLELVSVKKKEALRVLEGKELSDIHKLIIILVKLLNSG
jgi:hypothetical protein